MSAVFASWVLSRCRNRGRVPLINNIRSVSTMTTADSAVHISERLTYYLLVVVFKILVYIPLQHYFFFIPFIIPAPLSRSLPVVTQIRGHKAGPPPPSPLLHVPSFFHREENPASSSLVDSRRIFPTHAARRSQQLIPFYFRIFANIWSNLIVVGVELRDNQTLVVFEGKTTRPPGRPADNGLKQNRIFA